MNSVFIPSMEYTSKEIDAWQSADSPIETNITVGGCTLNSLIKHPYQDAFRNFGIPAGLVLTKGGVRNDSAATLTRDIVRGGGESIPNIISDKLYDTLFDTISVNPKKKILTRKIRK